MAISEPPYRAGDVLVVPFPYTDRLAEKRRPALVVSSDAVLEEGYLWVAMITSASNPPKRHDRVIADLASTGLSSPSRVRPLKVACIEPDRIVRRAGSLAEADAEAVFATLQTLIGSTDPATRKRRQDR